MKTVIMRTISSGPEGIYNIGDKRTLKDNEAAMLVVGGYAEYAPSGFVTRELATIEPEETRTAFEIISSKAIKKGKQK